jgi:hypothetical protein
MTLKIHLLKKKKNSWDFKYNKTVAILMPNSTKDNDGIYHEHVWPT